MRLVGTRWLRGSILAGTLLVGCPASGWMAHAQSTVTLTLVAYSTPREAYAQIIPAFQKTAAGRGVVFQTSYGASGDQSRAIAAGLPADVAAFSLEPDITRLVSAGLVSKDWNRDPYKGMVTDSVVVLVVRKANPKHIRAWSDLTRSGVEVITPNPFTSGGARWNVMAAYGAQIRQGKSKQEALAYLRALFAHVSVQDSSARAELQTFVGGKGDVMLAYENEAIAAQRAGNKIEYIVPDQTILIENPVAVISDSAHQSQARAFVSFLRSTTAQRLWGQNGYRPVVSSVAREFTFPKPRDLFTISAFGGWATVSKTFFDLQTGIMAQIERERGVGVGSH
jgi:sulfate/thiosulfate-binding protein